MAANIVITNSNVRDLSLRSILKENKLNYNNFTVWYRNLRIVLKQEKKLYVIDNPIPSEPPETDRERHDQWETYVEDSIQVSCLMYETMTLDLHKRLEHDWAYEMMQRLKEMFRQQVRIERFETVQALLRCKMDESQSVGTHVQKMKGFIDHIERLGCPISNEFATDMILNSLSKRFDKFVINYNKNGWNKPISELHMMLIKAEASHNMTWDKGIKRKCSSEPMTMVVKDMGKDKQVVQPMKNVQEVAKNDPCYGCGQVGHWKRKCPAYLEELKGMRIAGQTSGVEKEDEAQSGKDKFPYRR